MTLVKDRGSTPNASPIRKRLADRDGATERIRSSTTEEFSCWRRSAPTWTILLPIAASAARLFETCGIPLTMIANVRT